MIKIETGVNQYLVTRIAVDGMKVNADVRKLKNGNLEKVRNRNMRILIANLAYREMVRAGTERYLSRCIN